MYWDGFFAGSRAADVELTTAPQTCCALRPLTVLCMHVRLESTYRAERYIYACVFHSIYLMLEE